VNINPAPLIYQRFVQAHHELSRTYKERIVIVGFCGIPVTFQPQAGLLSLASVRSDSSTAPVLFAAFVGQ
jgi:hypothetical protein